VRLLLDQDVYAVTARLLRALAHDVVSAADLGLERATDETLLVVAQEQGRLFVTRDRHFGTLVFVRGLGAGVLYLRITPSTLDVVHQELLRVIAEHSEAELWNAFVVVEADGHRFRRLR
jgi:predicted nuclease of predicted toxin-antitoxin system